MSASRSWPSIRALSCIGLLLLGLAGCSGSATPSAGGSSPSAATPPASAPSARSSSSPRAPAASPAPTRAPLAADAPFRTYDIGWRFAYRNPSSLPLQALLTMPVPESESLRQEVSEVRMAPPATGQHRDAEGNLVVRVRLATMPAGGQGRGRLQARVRNIHLVGDVDASRLAPIRAVDWPVEIRRYREPSPGLPSDDAVLRAEVRRLAEDEVNPWYLALRLYDFTRSLQYQMTRRPQDVRQVLRTHVAQCSDAAALYVTLCRAAGLPARYVGGIFLTEEAREIRETHAWAEFWLPGTGWLPVDPTMSRFDAGLRLSRFAAAVPEYVGLWEGPKAPFSVGVDGGVDGRRGTAWPRFSLVFDVQEVPGGRGGPSLLARFPVPASTRSPDNEPSSMVPDPSNDPTPASATTREAADLLGAGKAGQALQKALEAARQAPQDWAAWRVLLEAAEAEQRIPQTLQQVRGALRTAPPWIRSSVEGSAQARLRHWTRAERALLEAVRLQDSAVTRENLGNLFRDTRQVTRALAEYQKALEDNPRSISTRRALVNLYAALDIWDGVAQVADQAEAWLPSLVEFPGSSGQARMRLKDFKGASEAFRRALRLAPSDGWLHAMLGWALREVGDRAAARQEIEQGLRLGLPASEKAFFERMARDLKS